MPQILRKAVLPQYVANPEIHNRFLVGANTPDLPMPVTARKSGRIVPDKAGMPLSQLNWFIEHKSEHAAEFYERLASDIGADKADTFVSLISSCWADGHKRYKGEILKLKRSVKSFVDNNCAIGTLPVYDAKYDTGEAAFSDGDIQKILGLNESMLRCVIDDWIAERRDGQEIGRSDVYVCRGIGIDQSMSAARTYRERDYICSYSMSVSVAEQFCQQVSNEKSALIHTKVDTFARRTLFFSPFIPGMRSHQFELGIIPGRKPDSLTYHGKFGPRGMEIEEYTLDPGE